MSSTRAYGGGPTCTRTSCVTPSSVSMRLISSATVSVSTLTIMRGLCHKVQAVGEGGEEGGGGGGRGGGEGAQVHLST